MRARTLLRFGAEVAFISVVAVIAHLADLSTAGIIMAMAVAWLLTAIAEGLVSRGWQGAATFVPPVRPFSGGLEHREPAPTWEASVAPPEEIAPAWLESAEVLGVHVAGFEPVAEPSVPESGPGDGGPGEPGGSPADAEAEEPEPVREEDTGPVAEEEPEEVPVAEEEPREPEALAEPEDEVAAAVAAEDEVMAQAAAVEEASEVPRQAAPDEAGVETEPEPVAVETETEPGPEPEPEPVAEPADPSASRREWNVLELERLARRLGGTDAARDEEWAFLLVYFREFANPDGALPADTDALVRESFPELVAVDETT